MSALQATLFAPATTQPSIQPRDYQIEAVTETKKLWDKGILNVLGVLPTGCGKTITFAWLIKSILQPGQRALILAHTDELVRQPRDKMLMVWPDANVGISKANVQQIDRQVICGSVATLANKKRMDALLAAGPIDILIVDECHHAVANSYRTIIKRLREANPRMRHLGVTATPNRADGKGLIIEYEAVAFDRDIWWAVEQGFLAPPLGYAIDARLDLSDLKTRGGDFDEGELAAALDAANWKDLIIDKWKELAAGRKTLAFTATVPMARALAKAFNDAGVKADWVSGEPYTTLERRQQVLRDYQFGDIQIVCNCAVLTEGFDAPETSCIIMAKPTKSAPLWIQCVGRGSRIFPGKTDFIVLEFADMGHTAVQFTDLLGDGDKEKKVKKEKQEGEGDEPATKEEQLLLAVMREIGEQEDKMYAGSPVQRVLNILGGMSKLAWYEMDGQLSLTLDAKNVLCLLAPQGDAAAARVAKALELKGQGVTFKPEWEEIFIHTEQSVANWQLVLVTGDAVEKMGYGRLPDMVKMAEKYVKKSGSKWADKKGRIHGDLASPKQVAFMDKLGIQHNGPVTKGVAMNAISHKLSMSVLERRGLLSRAPAPAQEEATAEA